MVIVSVFLFLQAAWYLFLGIALVLLSANQFGNGSVPGVVATSSLSTTGLEVLSGVFFLAFGLLALAILIGFLLRHRWAWVAAITWVTISLGVGLVGYFRGERSYFTLVVNIVLVIALNQSALDKEFRKTGDETA